MKILIAPDSFKGSLTAKEVAEAAQKGIQNVNGEADIEILPMADGGEGTITSLVEATHGSYLDVQVEDPLGRQITAQYGLTGDNSTAIIELASAAGLDKLTEAELNPYSASTYGTGQLIMHALDKGIRKFIICLGGSATNDGGVGILQALGFKFLDEHGRYIKSGGIGLKDLHLIDETGVPSEVFDASFQIACDVNNPFIGPNGASAVFGPQKGATPEMVQVLDEALTLFADQIEKKTGHSIHHLSGAGAAGGTAGGLTAFLNAELKSGIQLVMEAVKFENILQQNFDLLITGEGKIDGQTASGKVVSGLVEVAKRYNVSAIAIAGSVEGNLAPLYEKGLSAAFSITNGPMSLQDAMNKAPLLIEKQTEQVFRLLSLV